MEKEINISKIAEKSVNLEWFEMEDDLLAVTSEGIFKITKSSRFNKTCYNFYMEYDDDTPTNSFATLEETKEYARNFYVNNLFVNMSIVIDSYNIYNRNKNIINVKYRFLFVYFKLYHYLCNINQETN